MHSNSFTASNSRAFPFSVFGLTSFQHWGRAVEHMAAAAVGPDSAMPVLTLEGLAGSWESDQVIRSHALKMGTMLAWPSPKHVGVVTFETISKNARVMDLLLKLWCPQLTSAKTVNVDQLRAEERLPNSYVFLQ